ncbi:hypothetical protein ACIOD2_30935 [Amycolatopsis sp. NPDC088138]|uniref:hypothetical protein n=1 Tax=Amycolatopsis sp. NPDC088138 TaxID=3363938 RepID=UPI00382A1976
MTALCAGAAIRQHHEVGNLTADGAPKRRALAGPRERFALLAEIVATAATALFAAATTPQHLKVGGPAAGGAPERHALARPPERITLPAESVIVATTLRRAVR